MEETGNERSLIRAGFMVFFVSNLTTYIRFHLVLPIVVLVSFAGYLNNEGWLGLVYGLGAAFICVSFVSALFTALLLGAVSSMEGGDG
jgi:hypothetical protein